LPETTAQVVQYSPFRPGRFFPGVMAAFKSVLLGVPLFKPQVTISLYKS